MERREERNEEEYEWGVPAGPPPDLDLPFAKKRRREAGEWIYDNRETICITVIVYLLVAIVLLSSRIILQPRREDAAIVMDFSQAEELQRLEEELERAQRLNDMLNGIQAPDYGDVKNAVSNEHAEEMEESLSEETRELFERSEEVMEQMERNGAEYEQMLGMLGEERRPEERSAERRDARIAGGVTVSFSLARPVRHAVNLPVPSYKCSGGGTVGVDIVGSRTGDVLSASVDKSRSAVSRAVAPNPLPYPACPPYRPYRSGRRRFFHRFPFRLSAGIFGLRPFVTLRRVPFAGKDCGKRPTRCLAKAESRPSFADSCIPVLRPGGNRHSSLPFFP